MYIIVNPRLATAMRLWMSVFFLCVSSVSSEFNKGEWKEFKIKQGPVRGYRDSSGELWIFRNIPYATAPADKNKFKAPLPPPTWTEPLDSVDKRIVCPQFYEENIVKDAIIQENCLIANIYVPDTKKENLSVLVYVHGGAFQVGYGDWLNLRNLMRYEDFILVNFNYRLGIHGFLCLGTADVPGNAGMKDQVALLRWVQKNIQNFGGNPNDVTISGYSAGGSSVDLLMLSKAAEGLFHKVIPESGASLLAFTVQSDPLSIAKNHAKALNFTDVDNIQALEEFYKTLSYDILTADEFFLNEDSTFTFSPCVENDYWDGAFLTKSPLTILKTGDYKKVPVLFGFANMEGLMRIDLFDMWKDRMNEKFSDFLPADLKFESEEEKEKAANEIKEFYFGDKPVDTDTILHYVDYFSDVLFVQGALWVAKLHVEAGHDQVYLYEYSFVDESTPVVPFTNERGAMHVAQSFAVADGFNLTTNNKDVISEEYKKMKKIIRGIWHDFIITGKPVPKGSPLPAWPPIGAGNSPYMSLGQKLELGNAIAPERFNYWQTIYQEYYKEPIPPPYSPPTLHIEL
ncbi:unnamed protein product [Arctia plantaginis]|uniref:Carboxylic ester hydrolase n=2 Tax=Arctia plantaginis TaxID=874455 RepID=A0A8S1AFW8_ARCPL|nr:unnamed protein product [Arctia plantaginis]